MMIHLMRLELKKNPLKPIFIMFSACVATIFLFTYFFSFVSIVKPEEAVHNPSIMSYGFVLNMIYLISIVVFSLFTTFVFSSYILEDYKGDNLFISFTYPIKRSHYFISKLFVCLIIVTSLVILGQLIIYSIYFLTESFFPIMSQTEINETILLNVINTIFLVTIQSVLVGILSLSFSFRKKSIAVSISLSVLIAAILCNVNTITNKQVTFFVMIILSILSIVSIFFIVKQINALSIEGDY